MLRILEFGAQFAEGLRILVVSVDIANQADQLLERSGVDSTMFFNRVLDSRAHLLEIPPSLGYADDWDIQMASLDHRLQVNEDFFVCEVASRTEKDKRIRGNVIHSEPPVAGLSSCCFFQMPAKAIAHGRQQLIGIIGLASRTEALVERSGQDRGGNRFVDSRLDGPASFAGVRYAAGKLL